jgi:hypothetical protein
MVNLMLQDVATVNKPYVGNKIGDYNKEFA